MTISKTESRDGRKWIENEQISACYLCAGLFFAVAAGSLAGIARYWYGYFVMGQGVVSGLFIPWAAKTFCSGFNKPGKMVTKPGAVTVTLVGFTCFMIAQAIGFGMAQPWFDPVGWLGRVLQHDTKETVWGISLLGGAAARNFKMGINGGFWIFLNLLDISFMCFFLLVGINSRQEVEK